MFFDISVLDTEIYSPIMISHESLLILISLFEGMHFFYQVFTRNFFFFLFFYELDDATQVFFVFTQLVLLF